MIISYSMHPVDLKPKNTNPTNNAFHRNLYQVEAGDTERLVYAGDVLKGVNSNHEGLIWSRSRDENDICQVPT